MNTDWMERAACGPHIELPWTAADLGRHRHGIPAPEEQAQMAEICHGCPVLADCAAYALDQRCQDGMYAGVWVPATLYGHRTTMWHDARRLLAELVRPWTQ